MHSAKKPSSKRLLYEHDVLQQVQSLRITPFERDEVAAASAVVVTRRGGWSAALMDDTQGTVSDARFGQVKIMVVAKANKGQPQCVVCGRGWGPLHGCPMHMGVIFPPVPLLNSVMVEHLVPILRTLAPARCALAGPNESGLLLAFCTDHRERAKRIKTVQDLPPPQRLRVLWSMSKQQKTKDGEAFGVRWDVDILGNMKMADGQPGGVARAVTQERGGLQQEHVLDGAGLMRLLRSLTEFDVNLMGRAGQAPAECALFAELPVLPAAARPTSVLKGKPAPHPWTSKYNTIAEVVEDARTAAAARGLGLDPKTVGVARRLSQPVEAQRAVVHLLHTGHAKAKAKTASAAMARDHLSTMKDSVESKSGIIRAELLGKRLVGGSARTNISPCADLSHDQVSIFFARLLTTSGVCLGANETHSAQRDTLRSQVSVPWQTAERVQVPEVVNAHTLARLKRLPWRTASRILNERHEVVLNNLLKNRWDSVKIGWTVERPLLDGDVVLMGRHPVMNAGSMMVFRVVVEHGSRRTFAFHPDMCETFNADFDGDEMFFFPFSGVQSAVEMEELASVDNAVLSSATGSPIVGAHQVCLFCFRFLFCLLSRKNTPGRHTGAVAAHPGRHAAHSERAGSAAAVRPPRGPLAKVDRAAWVRHVAWPGRAGACAPPGRPRVCVERRRWRGGARRQVAGGAAHVFAHRPGARQPAPCRGEAQPGPRSLARRARRLASPV